MADYHYLNHNVSLAANTYAEAAAQEDPQVLSIIIFYLTIYDINIYIHKNLCRDTLAWPL